MEFVETSIFEKVSKAFLSEDELHQLQMTLSVYPTIGVLIQGSSGLRKLRWITSGKGKRVKNLIKRICIQTIYDICGH